MKRLLLPSLLTLALLPTGAAAIPAMPTTLLELAGIQPQPGRLHESVLIVIDVQRDYLPSGKLPLTDLSPAVAEIGQLTARARSAGVPVIHVQQLSPAGRGAFEAGSPGAEFLDESRPVGDEIVIQKRLPNAFAGTPLGETLRRLGRKRLIIVGCMTHMCVSATTRSALDHGYQVTVVANACATRDLRALDGTTLPAATVHRVALAELADRFATVVAGQDEIPL